MPNSLIFNQLLVANGQNFWYQTELLRQMQEQGIKPTKHVVQTVEDNIALAKEKLAPRVSFRTKWLHIRFMNLAV